MREGIFYARCVPPGEVSARGSTDIYRVEEEKDVRIDHYDWFASEGVVLGWSPIEGKVGIMAGRIQPADTPEQQIELSFYLGGKHLKSWTVAELKALGAVVVGPPEMMGRNHRRTEFQLHECVQVDHSNEYAFEIEVSGGKKIAFDILTGDIYAAHKLSKAEAIGLAARAAREERIALGSYEVGSISFNGRTRSWSVTCVRIPRVPGGHFTVQVDDQTQGTRIFRGR